MNQIIVKCEPLPMTYSGGELFLASESGDVYILKHLAGQGWTAYNLDGNGNWAGQRASVDEAVKGLKYLGDCKITIEQL